jgi:hypothetical protein
LAYCRYKRVVYVEDPHMEIRDMTALRDIVTKKSVSE